MRTNAQPIPPQRFVAGPLLGQRVAARPWLWLPAPGASAANTLAPYYCAATVTGVLVDAVEIEFDQPVTEVWPKRQMAAPADLHPWPHHCRECRTTAAPLDPATVIDALRRRCAALEAERDALQAELFATRTAPQIPA
jgi:hypothetical protein